MKITHHMPNPGPEPARLSCPPDWLRGNGSAVLFGLPYLHYALIAWGFTDGLQVTVVHAESFPPPIVCVSPLALPTSGRTRRPSSSTASISFTASHGGRTRHSSRRIAPNNTGSSYDNTIDFVISCVDTRAARQEMHEAFNTKTGTMAQGRLLARHWKQCQQWPVCDRTAPQ